MITVVPDGGLKGWYADWAMQHTVMGAANWESFHLTQVVPFIDANLRTHLWRMRQAARIVYAAPGLTLRALSISASARRLVTRAATESLR